MATKTAMKQSLSMAAAVALILSAAFLAPEKGQAIPAFARQYQTSCTTCHSDFPKLNDFGKAFKDAGFKFPNDDETFIKVPPTMLGAEQQKQLWPKVVWPGSIPGMPPIGLRMNTFFQVQGKRRGAFDVLTTAPGDVPSSFVPRTDFQTGLFSIFTAGNFGSDIAFWVDEDFSVGGDNTAGGLGDGYLKFVNIGRFIHLPKDALSLRVGQFELDLPFSPARSYNISGWDIYDQSNFGSLHAVSPQQFVNNTFALSNAAQGIELSGGHQYGGYHYSIAVVNQNTGGTPDTGSFVPTANGVGFMSDSNFKDLYARFSYRFNLERDPESRHAVQAAGATGPRDHTFLTLGTLYFYGRSVQRITGLDAASNPTVLTAREPFYRVGGDFNFNYRKFNLYGQYLYGHDKNLLPVDALGNPVPLPPPTAFDPLNPPTALTFASGIPTTFSGGFLQADYLLYPWMMLIMRYDAVNSNSDRLNGSVQGPASFPNPFDVTRNRFTPGVQFLIHANIKASFEYQIRPQQTVTYDPTTQLPTNPFRSNAATVALEWVY
jgi:hypothetical protein